MDESTFTFVSWLEAFVSWAFTVKPDTWDWLIVAETRFASTPAESASLWAIRISLGMMVLVFGMDIYGGKTHRIKRLNRTAGIIWLAGATLSLCHSLGSIATFHLGSQTLAFEATAQQTQELLGFRFGAGLFVNYAFVVVWLFDAITRVFLPAQYDRFPKVYSYLTNVFLAFVAFNGAIVFQSGWIRWIGLVCVGMLTLLAWYRRKARSVEGDDSGQDNL